MSDWSVVFLVFAVAVAAYLLGRSERTDKAVSRAVAQTQDERKQADLRHWLTEAHRKQFELASQLGKVATRLGRARQKIARMHRESRAVRARQEDEQR